MDEIYAGLGGFQKTGVVTAKYGGATLAAPVHAVKHTVLFGWDIVKAGAHRCAQTGRDTARTARAIDSNLTLSFSKDDGKRQEFLEKAGKNEAAAEAECGLRPQDIAALAKARLAEKAAEEAVKTVAEATATA